MLTNPFYYGLFEYNGEIFQGIHSSIIEKELFDKVQEVLKFRSKPTLRKHYFVFRGFIRCAKCGSQITAETQKNHNYYHCARRRDPCPQSSIFVREENLAKQIKEAIMKVALDDRQFSIMMEELNREKILVEAEKVTNQVTTERKTEDIDEQLKRLLDLVVSGSISNEEYKQKKAQLMNKKFDILNGGNHDGDWIEPFKNFLTLAHQATYVAAEANLEAQRDFLRRIVSNLKLLDGKLIVSYSCEFRILAENKDKDLGSQELCCANPDLL
jgi:hypothetical protein